MCKLIEFDAFLGTVLERQDEITFRQLREMVEYFESLSIVVDFSSQATAAALSYYPQFFSISREKKCYLRAAQFDPCIVHDEFAPAIPSEIRKQIDSILNGTPENHVGSRN